MKYDLISRNQFDNSKRFLQPHWSVTSIIIFWLKVSLAAPSNFETDDNYLVSVYDVCNIYTLMQNTSFSFLLLHTTTTLTDVFVYLYHIYIIHILFKQNVMCCSVNYSYGTRLPGNHCTHSRFLLRYNIPVKIIEHIP